MNILWFGKTGKANAWYHITLTTLAEKIKNVYVVRDSPPSREIESHKVSFFHFKGGNTLRYVLNMIKEGIKVITDKEIDAIITFNVFPYGFLSYLLAMLFKKRLILCFIGWDFDYYLKKQPWRYLVLKSVRRADLIICKGEHMRKGLIAEGINESKLELYPHYVSDEYFNSVKSESKYDIITVCELVERKRIDIIISAIAHLKNKDVEVKFCIVGDGPEKETLLKQASKLGIASQIDFVGNQQEIIPFLNQADIFVQTSYSEGLSLALLESIAVGLIPVVTNAGAEKDIINHGVNGFILKQNDVKDLSEKLELLLTDTPLKIKIQSEVNQFKESIRQRNIQQKVNNLFEHISK